jgi:peptidoglycan/LPS O-acetylase OafA/YrhL
MTNRRFDRLDALRGFAAFTVVLHHCFRAHENTNVGLLWWFENTPLRLIVSGRPAVILFFVLSGFVLALSLEKAMTYRDFVIRRVCRIYLPFAASIALAAMIFTMADQAVLPGYDALYNRTEPLSWQLIAGHLMMLGDTHSSSLNKVMWSLVYELRISLIFPVLMWLIYRYPAWRTLAASLAAALVAYGALRHLGYGPRDFKFSNSAAASVWLTVHFTLYFVMGAALAKHREQIVTVARGYSPNQRFILLGLGSAGLLALSTVVTDITLGLWSVLIIVLVLAGGRLTQAIFESRPAAYLGRISYSLYLVHLPVFYWAAHAWPGGAMPLALIWIVWPLLSVVAAAIMYHLIEHPAHRLGKAIVAKWNVAPATLAPRAS